MPLVNIKGKIGCIYGHSELFILHSLENRRVNICVHFIPRGKNSALGFLGEAALLQEREKMIYAS